MSISALSGTFRRCGHLLGIRRQIQDVATKMIDQVLGDVLVPHTGEHPLFRIHNRDQ